MDGRWTPNESNEELFACFLPIENTRKIDYAAVKA
jgi:hypothetical protein